MCTHCLSFSVIFSTYTFVVCSIRLLTYLLTYYQYAWNSFAVNSATNYSHPLSFDTVIARRKQSRFVDQDVDVEPLEHDIDKVCYIMSLHVRTGVE